MREMTVLVLEEEDMVGLGTGMPFLKRGTKPCGCLTTPF